MALKVLYQNVLLGTDSASALYNVQKAQGKEGRRVRDFAVSLERGVNRSKEKLDHILEGCLAPEWSYRRLGILERCILRMASYEILYRDEIPCRVSIDEAIELAKTYIGDDAARLVNGVLHKFARKFDPEGLSGNVRVTGGDAETTPGGDNS